MHNAAAKLRSRHRSDRIPANQNGVDRPLLPFSWPNLDLKNGSERIGFYSFPPRARIGWLATDNLLIFATGGYAFGKASLSAGIEGPNFAGVSGTYSFVCGGPGVICFSGGKSHVVDGWTLGGGFEFALSRNVKIKLEYLHVDLGSSSIVVMANRTAGAFPNPASFTLKTDNAFDIFRAGINIRL